MVGLSRLDSNRFDIIIRFKKSCLGDELRQPALPKGREINESGETIVKKIEQTQKWLNTEEMELLISEYKAGKTTYELAKQFGCHRRTVACTLKRHGVQVSKCRAHDKLNIPDVIAMYANMHTSTEIAKKYGVHPNVVIRCLREHGTVVRGRWDY